MLTHGHFDHVSAAAELASEWRVPVYAHRLEFPYLTGESEYPRPNVGAGGGLIATSVRMASDERWHALANYAFATGLVMIVLFVVQLALARSPEALLGAWGGIVQRLTVAAWFACTIVLALKLRCIGAAADGPR